MTNTLDLTAYPQWMWSDIRWPGPLGPYDGLPAEPGSKRPLRATGVPGAKDNPNHRTTYERAMRAASGAAWGEAGFVLTEHDPFICIDLDWKPRHGDDAKRMIDDAAAYFRRRGHYVERSVSLRGWHVLCAWPDGTPLPPNRRDPDGGPVEFYTGVGDQPGRGASWIVITQDTRCDIRRIRVDDGAAAAFYRKRYGQPPPRVDEDASPTVGVLEDRSDADVLERLKRNPDAAALYFTPPSVAEDMSRADWRLFIRLGYLTDDDAQLERLWLSSARAHRPRKCRYPDKGTDTAYIRKSIASMRRMHAGDRSRAHEAVKHLVCQAPLTHG